MAFVSMDSRPRTVEMLQKGSLQPVFARTSRASMALSDVSDIETEFEDDMSDFDDYAGRRSEDSYGKRSDTTVETFEELRTPASNEFKSFNFQLPKEDTSASPKKIVGPTGPHLFRYSLESSNEQQVSVEWSPIDSPQRAGPKHLQQSRRYIAPAPPSSIPLECWSPPQVAGWVRAKGLDESLVQSLLVNDISGAILKELKFGDLKELGIDSFGQRHQLWDEIRNLRGSVSLPPTPADESFPWEQTPTPQPQPQVQRASPCSNPPSPEEEDGRTPAFARRRARRALRPDDVISPAESASIVAIEQLLPKPHHCSKGENCAKWRKQQRQMARIAKEFPMELEQIEQAEAPPSEVTFRPTSEVVPSVVASSDVMGPGLPSLRLDEEVLRVVPPRDPQENVRQFLSFQHLNDSTPELAESPTYDMFPPLSPPATTQAPHTNLSKLPKLAIPLSANDLAQQDAERTVIRQTRSPVTAVEYRGAQDRDQDVFRIASPASAMDVPLTALPIAPIARDTSQSVPPNMQFGNAQDMLRSNSRSGYRPWEPVSPITRPQTASNQFLQPPSSSAPRHQPSRQPSRSRRPSFAMAPLQETSQASEQQVDGGRTPTAESSSKPKFAGWMKKRKTKMLRHEWQENHFRLDGTTLAMHRDSKALDALEYIDVDDYAVACSSMASNRKLGAAFKNFKISSGGNKKDEKSTDAFCFQLVPSASNPDGTKASLLAAAMATASGKSHHFAAKTQDDRIDWMRELMLAKALKEKGRGCEINLNGNMI